MSRIALTIVLASCGIAGGIAQAQSVVGLTSSGDRLVSFSPSNVGTLTSDIGITGLGSGETITNIDFRPRTGELFGISSMNRLYILNITTGAATLRQNAGVTPFSINGRAGMDFNPVPDRIRVVTSSVQNLRLNPDTGALAADDGVAQLPNPALRFVAGDANVGVTPNLVSVAYTNSTFGLPAPTSTTMFAVHRQSNFVTTLVRQGSVGGAPDSPNNGNLTTIGSIAGIFTDDQMGFDIFSGFGGNVAYFSGNVIAGGTAFYTLDLGTGANTFLGNIGGSNPIRDFSVIPAPASAGLVCVAGLTALRRRRR